MIYDINNEKSSQKRRKHCTLTVVRYVEPKIFAQPQTLFPGAQDGQNVISWRWSLPLLTNPVWWRLMHAISSYRGNRPTPTHTHTNIQDWLQYTAPLASAHVIIIIIIIMLLLLLLLLPDTSLWSDVVIALKHKFSVCRVPFFHSMNRFRHDRKCSVNFKAICWRPRSCEPVILFCGLCKMQI